MEKLMGLSSQELVELCLKLQGELEDAEKSKNTLYEMFEAKKRSWKISETQLNRW